MQSCDDTGPADDGKSNDLVVNTVGITKQKTSIPPCPIGLDGLTILVCPLILFTSIIS